MKIKIMPTEFSMQQNKKDIGSALHIICIMYVGCGCVRFTLLTPTNSGPDSK